ncbi:MAG: alpha/beta hydrolase [Candidatus Woesearchaeota archaeon]|jgi:hypothetical protein
MTTVFIIHGCNNSPKDNWFLWLKLKLENKGYTVFVPQFPIYHNQKPEQWMRTLKTYEKHITPDSIFIGHSLGATFLLHILEKYHIHTAYIIAGFASRLDNEFDEPTKAFIHPFDWKIIRKKCKKIYVIHADNDPYVPLKKAEELAKKLGVTICLIKNGGHCCEKKFPGLLKMIS